MQKNKHYKLIIKWAEGHKIDFFNKLTEQWEFTSRPTWSEETEYRLSGGNEQVLYTATWFDEDTKRFEISDELTDYQAHGDNVKITFDNDSKDILKIEVCREWD